MKILVALDGSSFAEAALEIAAKLAEAKDAEVQLITVIVEGKIHPVWRGGEALEGFSWGHLTEMTDGAPSSMPTTGQPVAVLTKDQALEQGMRVAREYLEGVSETLLPKQAKVEVVVGRDVAGEILNHARSQGIDLIVLATHGRTGLPKLLMGSVASKVLGAGVAPVLMVRPGNLDGNGKKARHGGAR